MKKHSGRGGPRVISIKPAKIEETMVGAFELVTVHGGCPLRGDAAPSQQAPTSDLELADRFRARWANASPAARAMAAFLLAFKGMPDTYPVRILGTPVPVERLSLDAVALVLAEIDGWLTFVGAGAEARLQRRYGPAIRRVGYDIAALTPDQVVDAGLALQLLPKPKHAGRVRKAKWYGMRAACEGIWLAKEGRKPIAVILADAARVRANLVAMRNGATGAAFREGVLVVVKGARETLHEQLAIDIACALVFGSSVPTGHERLEIEAAIADMA